jgi:hypothetical protein
MGQTEGRSPPPSSPVGALDKSLFGAPSGVVSTPLTQQAPQQPSPPLPPTSVIESSRVVCICLQTQQGGMGLNLCDTIAWLIVPEQLICCHIHPLRTRHNSLLSLGLPFTYPSSMPFIFVLLTMFASLAIRIIGFLSLLLVACCPSNIAVFIGVA